LTAYVRPRSLDEALRARAEHPDWLVLAGGTDVMVKAAQRPPPPGVIDVFGLGPLVGVDRTADGALRIGAATTYARLLRSDLVRRHAPALAAAAREVGALQIQARGTIGGNVGTSSPVGDTLPVLLALDASVEVASRGGERTVPYEDFCTGYRATALGPDELIVAVRIPAAAAEARQFWRKVGTRRAQSISKVMFAAAARAADDGAVTNARIALGAVRERPIRARHAEAELIGNPPTPEVAARVGDALMADISPIDDVRSTADYRRAVAGNLAARFVTWLGARVSG
jgi:CO/xanthine dehydrogenase FAD-binding subunit